MYFQTELQTFRARAGDYKVSGFITKGSKTFPPSFST